MELALLNAVLNASDDAIVGIRRDGIIVSWNEAAERLFGYSGSEALGASYWKLLVPADRDGEARALWSQLAEARAVERLETVRLRKDGTLAHVSVALAPLRDERGEVTGAVKLLRDRSDRVRYEQNLRSQEEVARDMSVIAKVGGWSFDPVTGEGTWTDEVARIHDLDPSDPTSKDIGLSFYVDESRQRVAAAIERAVGAAEPYDLELELTSARGRRKWVRTIGRPLVEGGRVVRVRGSFQDITERKQAQLMLSAQYMVNSALLAAGTLADAAEPVVRALCTIDHFVGGALFVLDGDAELMRCAGVWSEPVEAVASLFALVQTKAFTLGRGLMGRASATRQVVWSTDIARDGMAELVPLAQAAGASAALSVPIIGSEGVVGALSLLARDLVQPDEARVAGLLAIGSQVGQFVERRKAQTGLARLNAELEQRVQARTAELEAANRELESFSYTVSHDLRAPLRVIHGFSTLLASTVPDLAPEAREYLEPIRKNAIRMSELIDDLLDLSRLSRKVIRLGEVDVTAMVSELVAELAREHQGRSVEVTVGALPRCRGDASLLRQVWTNLISNAFKYTARRAHATVEIGFLPEVCAYFIRDNGAGFDPRYADKLFGVFQRLHQADEYEGTGVGLAIVERIVTRHGGRVWASSEVDQGATFYFTLDGILPS